MRRVRPRSLVLLGLMAAPVAASAATMGFAGTGSIGGQAVQTLVGDIDGSIVPAPAGRGTAFWPFLLLHPTGAETGFLSDASAIGELREGIIGPSWLYPTAPLAGSSGFDLQLIPDLATDVFLPGRLTETAASVRIGAASWSEPKSRF